MSNILICGFKGSGKTTLGAWISKTLGCPHIDTDAWIEARTGTPKRTLFQQDGGVSFRKIETEVVHALQGCTHHVISLGGGTLCNPNHIQILLGLGVMLYLKVSKTQLQQRHISFPFPNWETVFEERTAFFASLPVVVVHGE